MISTMIAAIMIGINPNSVPFNDAYATANFTIESVTNEYNVADAGLLDPDTEDYVFWQSEDFSNISFNGYGYDIHVHTGSGDKQGSIEGYMSIQILKGTETTAPSSVVSLSCSVSGTTFSSGQSSSANVHGMGYSMSASGSCGGPYANYDKPDSYSSTKQGDLEDIGDGLFAWQIRVYSHADVSVSIG